MLLTHQWFRCALLPAALALVCVPALRAAEEWKPVDPADLALRKARVDPDADAEAIFWEVWVTDQPISGKIEFDHYLRLKIFTEHGRDTHSTIDLPFAGKSSITDIAGRTIKPDGSIVELTSGAVYERMLVRAGGYKIRAKSFAMPAVEPGAIIEYRWRERLQSRHANYFPLPFQREIPIELVRYHIKPVGVDLTRADLRVLTFNCPRASPVEEPKGFHAFEMTNVPAFIAEPHMPPESQVRIWMLAYWESIDYLHTSQFWTAYSQRSYQAYKPFLKVDGEVRSTAASIVSGASTPEDKLRRLFDYCRTNIKNLRGESVTAEERAEAAKNKHPADTIRHRAGTGFDIDMAFAALATAAGFDARPAWLADRSDAFFNPKFTVPYFLRAYDIAVNVEGKWRFYDPASTYVAFGMLRWQEEGETALVADPREPVFVETPLSPPDMSLRKRAGRFALTADGALEGDVRLEFTGHEAVSRKRSLEGETPAQQVELVREFVQDRLSTAEVTGMQVANAKDLEKPLVYQYHVKIPGYAERTGKRLFLRPAFFQFNVPARFPSATRKYPVYFEYPWSENDEVAIQLPPGFELDHAEQPQSITFGTPGRYDVNVAISKDRRLVYTRKFSFGAGGQILYQPEVYPRLKRVFDAIHEADDHIVTLKQEVAAK